MIEYDMANSLYDQAMCAAESGDLDLAIKLASDAFKYLAHPHTALRLSIWCADLGDTHEALKWAAIGNSLNPVNTQIADRFAEECLNSGLIDRGIEILERSLELNSVHGPSQRLLERAVRLKAEQDDEEVPS